MNIAYVRSELYCTICLSLTGGSALESSSTRELDKASLLPPRELLVFRLDRADIFITICILMISFPLLFWFIFMFTRGFVSLNDRVGLLAPPILRLTDSRPPDGLASACGVTSVK